MDPTSSNQHSSSNESSNRRGDDAHSNQRHNQRDKRNKDKFDSRKQNQRDDRESHDQPRKGSSSEQHLTEPAPKPAANIWEERIKSRRPNNDSDTIDGSSTGSNRDINTIHETAGPTRPKAQAKPRRERIPSKVRLHAGFTHIVIYAHCVIHNVMTVICAHCVIKL